MENTHNEPVASKSVRGTDGTATPPALLSSPFTRHDGWTGEKIAIFCEALAETAVVAEACDQAGMGISGAYAFRRRSPIFAAAWDAALTIARERLADTLLARSMEGNIELLWKDGEVVGERHLLDNRLGLAILKRLDRIAEREQCSCAMSGTHRSPNGAGSRSWSPAQTRTPAVRSEPFDWNLAIDALRTGNEDDICKALALVKGDEVEEVEGHPFFPGDGDDDSGEIDLSHRCWKDGDGTWMTSFPSPAGFTGHESCDWGDPEETYERECTEEESAILEADAAATTAAERAEEEELRDSWFEVLRAAAPPAQAERRAVDVDLGHPGRVHD